MIGVVCDVACMCAVCVYIEQVSIASDAILTVILMKIGNQVSQLLTKWCNENPPHDAQCRCVW